MRRHLPWILAAFVSLVTHRAAAQEEIEVIAGSRSAMPSECDQSTPYYGPVEVGSLVALHRHRPWRGQDNWSRPMDAFEDTIARVVELAGLDPSGCPGVHVDVDGGQFFWRIRDLDLARVVTPRTARAEPVATLGYAPHRAQQRYANAYVDRPLTLAEGVLSPYASLGLAHQTPGTGAGESLSLVGDVAMDYGIVDWLEVGADLAPVSLWPSAAYFDPSLRATARFLSGGIEMGFRVTGWIPVRSGESFALGLGLPVRIHLMGYGRLDLTPTFLFDFGDPIVARFSVPAALAFNLGQYVFVGASSGVSFRLDRPDSSLAVPLGFFAGGTAMGESGPIVDVRGGFGWPSLYRSWISPAGTASHTVDTDAWVVSLDARFYIYMPY
jgi:hypothetical protein